jgi:hypothetical protein
MNGAISRDEVSCANRKGKARQPRLQSKLGASNVSQRQRTHRCLAEAPDAPEDLDISAPRSWQPPNGWTFETSSCTWQIYLSAGVWERRMQISVNRESIIHLENCRRRSMLQDDINSSRTSSHGRIYGDAPWVYIYCASCPLRKWFVASTSAQTSLLQSQ